MASLLNITNKLFLNNNKVYIPLRCRLANQMFEYAMVRSVALETGGTPVLYKYDENDFLLDCFELCPELEFAPDSYHSICNVIGKYLQKKSVRHNETNAQRYAREKRSRWWLALFGIFHVEVGYAKPITWPMWHRNVHCFGWFQSEDYFKAHKELIKKEFTFKKEIQDRCQAIVDEVQACESVCLHIRLGDYVTTYSAAFLVCTKEYYRKAVELIREKKPNAKFYVFTDSPDIFLKDYNIFENTNDTNENAIFKLIPESYTGPESMYIGSKCKNHIMSNSSYSWWMQYLGQNPEQIVIAPQRWFNEDQIVDGLYMKNWILL